MSAERWALFSVFNKAGVVEDARRLVNLGWKIISSGGTAKALAAADVPVKDVAELVGGGAILGHRVVTLSRQVHAGLLANPKRPEDMAELEKSGIPFIDFVRCDFYPLSKAIADLTATVDSVVEMTDIGGPCMVRSGAKGGRIVVCRKQDMESVLQELEQTSDVSQEHRQKLRARAEYEVAKYVMDSARFHGDGMFDGMIGELARQLAYGENRDQSPANLFACDNNDPLAWHNFDVLTGDPSYISTADGDRALGVMCAMAEAFRVNCGKVPAISIACKHGNPCGIGIDFNRPDLSVMRAMLGDPVAVMGAEFITNFPIDADLGRAIYEIPSIDQQNIGRKYWGIDVLYAPAVDGATVELLGKKERRRILVNPALSDPRLPPYTWMYREVRGGFLRQKNYHYVLDFKDLAKMTGDLSEYMFNIIIAWGAAWRSVSNTVAIAKNGMLLSMGCGQQDRIACVQLCLDRAKRSNHDTYGSAFASDGFFPYAKRSSENAPLEGSELLVKAGCRSGVVPYDGKNVAEVEEYFRQAGVAVAFVKPEHRGFFGH